MQKEAVLGVFLVDTCVFDCFFANRKKDRIQRTDDRRQMKLDAESFDLAQDRRHKKISHRYPLPRAQVLQIFWTRIYTDLHRCFLLNKQNLTEKMVFFRLNKVV